MKSFIKAKLMLYKPLFIIHDRVKGPFELILDYKNESPQLQKWAWYMHNKIKTHSSELCGQVKYNTWLLPWVIYLND